MKINYCLPIIKSKADEVIKTLADHQKDYDYFEIWLDYIKDFNLDLMRNLNKKYGPQLIFLFRRRNLQKPKMDLEQKIKIMKMLDQSESFLDLDIFAQKKELALLKTFKKIRFIASYHNYQETPGDKKLHEVIALMKKYHPEIYKISTLCQSPSDALRLIDLLTELKEKNASCIVSGMGQKGRISRIAGAIWGNALSYTPVRIREQSAEGQLTKLQFNRILKNIKICYFVADPAKHSLSPQMHEAGYFALGIEDKFLFLRRRVNKRGLKQFIDEVKKDPHFCGAGISIPHKTEVTKYLDDIGGIAKKIGAVNTVIKRGGKLIGFNTDWIGVVEALQKKIKIKGKKVALIGAGGAARAAAYGLIKNKAKVKIFNRSLVHAKKLAQDFGCDFSDLNDLKEITKMDIIINATSVGMNEDKSPVNKNFLIKNHLVFDMVYSPPLTRLIKDAMDCGAQVILGKEMLLHQGAVQFELFTDRKAPVETMREALT